MLDWLYRWLDRRRGRSLACRHEEFTRWSDPFVVHKTRTYTNGRKADITEVWQDRACTQCGLVEQRELENAVRTDAHATTDGDA